MASKKTKKTSKKAAKKAPSKMPPSQTLMAGLHFEAGDIDAGKPWRITADSIDVLKSALGSPLLNAFVRCAAAADRLVTILDCMRLNNEAGVDTVRGERTLNTLAVFAAGLVYEFREGVRALRAAGLPAKLGAEGMKRWRRLESLIDLKNEDAICQIRNQLAFHIGKEQDVRKGIQRVSAEGRKVVLATGDSAAMGEGRRDFGTDVLLAGIRIRPPGKRKGTPNSRRPMTREDFSDAFDEVKAFQFEGVPLCDHLLVDALRHAGANFDTPPPFRGGEADASTE